MMKRLTTGLLATAAATAAFALAVPAAAQAAAPAAASAAAGSSGYDYDDYWGSYYSGNHKAKANGWIGVDWNRRQTSNEVHLRGKVYDLDHRTYRQGGKCALVRVQAHRFDDHHGYWAERESYRHCGAGGYKRFHFAADDVDSVRVQVCQIGLHSSHPTRCGDWEYLYTAESE
ncbi:hypothetical protein PS9374_01682 [Planomonospora sphaerica]|uniref:Secreted protein n=1 Tax=Planomonospora sphaerica TaxID=161355 RepID=A0A171C389_9ACTN|nr:hypothetical protein [Planomonospora sphaerica]GAT66038.1 hypothetical protein PS9374_01682 [Planomonospora sphaerica]